MAFHASCEYVTGPNSMRTHPLTSHEQARHRYIVLPADPVVRKEFCSIELTESKHKAFVFAIRNHYWYQMYLGKWGLCVNPIYM